MKKNFLLPTLLLAIFACLGTLTLEAAEVRFERESDSVKVFLDDSFFTEYRFRDGQNPIFWPIIGPTGEKMSRSYPMEEGVPDERRDHPHHRSLWFTHGEISGVNFWHTSDEAGIIEHVEFSSLEPPTMRVKNSWKDREGRVVLSDERSITFGADDLGRWIDFAILLSASNGDVVFADTKEGTFGFRVPGVLDVDRRKGGKIINSEGLVDDAAWGKRAAWVDYNGVMNEKPVGIAIMNHPQSAFYPTYWHVRTYGLFAANPFGVGDFTKQKGHPGEYTLPKGQTLRLMYRVYFHAGDESEGKVAENFEKYSK
ncbi:MAG: PmoA family protein [Planctomycetia bacterium]|nr:PmoA family protein [Planctomycetia bacterium]